MLIQMLDDAIFIVLALTSHLAHIVDTIQCQVGRLLEFGELTATGSLVLIVSIFAGLYKATVVASKFQII
jgi:hypothetical protein